MAARATMSFFSHCTNHITKRTTETMKAAKAAKISEFTNVLTKTDHHESLEIASFCSSLDLGDIPRALRVRFDVDE
jgi:hypothetical protein